MIIRKSTPRDLERILEIYALARRFMAEHGNPHQWGPTNWPPEQLIRTDIRDGNSYVCINDGGRVIGTFFFVQGRDIEPTYRRITDGAWRDDSPYGVVHRIAADGSEKGVGSFCIQWAVEQCGHLRIDTHGDNTVMRNLLAKLGFVRCGTIYVEEDDFPRLAFEKTDSETNTAGYKEGISVLKFDEQKQIESVRGALALRSRIEAIVDEVWSRGLKNLCWLGIGGTWASCLQAVCHMKERTGLETFAANAAEYCATGDRRIGKGTFVVFSSVSGTTPEMAAAVEKAQLAGAELLGFVDQADALLAELADYCISYPANEQLKFFMTADRFLYRNGEMPEYTAMYDQFDRCLPEALAAAEQAADGFGAAFAAAHKDDPLHYFLGAGTLYGATYSYAMCYWEEQHWLRTKSIHAAEFFHGTLEIIDQDTPVTLFVGEDAQRSIALRAARFLPKICRNYTVIDTRDYALPGIDEAYRGAVCHLVMHAVTNRIDAHLEALTGHDMRLRRYYRKVDY